jgi:hypothetical protein
MYLPDAEKPQSRLMALDPFQFNSRGKTTEGIWREDDEEEVHVVPKGKSILFTNKQWHQGGANGTDKRIYRLFSYEVKEFYHIDMGKIYHPRIVSPTAVTTKKPPKGKRLSK